MTSAQTSHLWDRAIGMPDRMAAEGATGAFVPETPDSDRIVVVYNAADPEPVIAIEPLSDIVFKITAGGMPVAIVARVGQPAPRVSDVLLVARAG